MLVKVILYDRLLEKSSCENWTFVGSDYLKLSICRKKIIGKRIPLNHFYREEMVKLRPKILLWLSAQKAFNNDSLFWWMTHIAGKNNIGIKTFLDILQISTLKNQILTQSNLRELLIICEDIYIYKL